VTPTVDASFVVTTPVNARAAGYRSFEFARVAIDGTQSEYRLVCPAVSKKCFASFAPADPSNAVSWTTANAAKAARLRGSVASHVAYWTKIVSSINRAEGRPPSVADEDGTEVTTGNENGSGSFSITLEVHEGTSTLSVNLLNPAEQEFSMFISDEANEQVDSLQELTALTPAQWRKKVRRP
jgi:hypothetical protein